MKTEFAGVGRRHVRGLAVAAAAFAVALTMTQAAQSLELVYGSWVSPRHSVMRFGTPEFFKDVTKATKGELTFRLVAGGQLADVKGTIPGLKDGLFDLGFVIPPFAPSYIPAINLMFSTQFFGSDGVAATGAQLETMLLNCPQCLAEATKSGIITLGGFSTTPFVLMCRDKVAGPADLKGKKVRAVGGAIQTLKMAGATPVAMSPAAATQALQRGAVDCVLGPPAWLRSYGYQDVVKYVLDYPLGMTGPAMHLGVSRKRYYSLTPSQRKAMVDATPRSVAIAALIGYIKTDQTIIEAAKKKGVTFLPGGNSFDAIVEKREKDQREANIKAAQRFNIPDPDKMLDALASSFKKWKALSKDIGQDTDKFAAALKREIYDKVDPEKL
ncbi:MAG: C4-dicarboxylate TRAP transporter substrate-binding protein [Beijerinckiaceae bacterium]